MFTRTLKIILAILFIPVVVASTRAFFLSLNMLTIFNVNLFMLGLGFFTYPIFHIVLFKPMYLYTLGHEIVHVIATWLCGGKVTSFHISRAGGSVTTTKTNLFITLSPYFVPIHTLFLFAFFWVLSRFINLTGFLNELMFLLGFMVGFHIFMTIEVMKMRQPDMAKAGLLFSILFVYTANICMLLFIGSVIFRDISFVSFAKNTFIFSKNTYLSIFSSLF